MTRFLPIRANSATVLAKAGSKLFAELGLKSIDLVFEFLHFVRRLVFKIVHFVFDILDFVFVVRVISNLLLDFAGLLFDVGLCFVGGGVDFFYRAFIGLSQCHGGRCD